MQLGSTFHFKCDREIYIKAREKALSVRFPGSRYRKEFPSVNILPEFYVHNCILMPLSIAIHHTNMLPILSCAFEFESEYPNSSLS